MKVKEIIKLCNDMGDLNLPERYFFGDGREALQDEKVKKLVLCCNCVLEETYCEYATEIGRCQVRAEDNFIPTDKLNLNRVISLTDVNGNYVKYRYTAGGLFAENGNYVLTYAKLPAKVYWEEEVVPPDPRITDRILAYGIVSEYFLSTGDVAISEQWSERFQNALRAQNTKKSPMSLPVGRWLQ